MPRIRIPKTAITEPITTIYADQVTQAVRQRQMSKIDRESLRLITRIDDDMRDRLGALLREGVEQGRSVSATASTLLKTGLDKGTFRSARRRAWMIAKTELHRARMLAARDVYEANGIDLVKWIGIGDERICPVCGRMHNRVFRLRDIRDEHLPPVHPRCRCRVVPSDMQMDITVRHDREGKVVESKVAPNPHDYLYVVKLKKALEDLMKAVQVRGEDLVQGTPLFKADDNEIDLEKSEFSSTQVNLPKVLASKVLNTVKLIDPDDLHPTEKQDDAPHITVRYGILPEVPPKHVKEILDHPGKVKASITGVDVFQPEDKDYDVLVFRIDSPDLNLLNEKLKQLPHEDTYPFYQPHSTIAYLKRGLGKKYVNLVTGLEGEEIEFDTIKFSDKDYKKVSIDLEKAFGGLETELEKARPYIRTKKGKLEHVKGYPHRPRLFDVSPEKRIERALEPTREDVKMVNRISHEIHAIGGRALIVGGFVRDALLGRPSKDIDVEVYGVKPTELRSVLDRIGKVDAVGASFGVLKVSAPEMDEPLDVSIPRRDSKVGTGHKGFIVEADPGMTPKEAALRRDLTINSLAYDPITKEIIDEYGGLQDIKDRKLSATDDTTFVEDPLRVLRVMRFSAQLGFSPTVKLAWLCRSVDLTSLPKERIYGELEKTLMSKNPSIGLMLTKILGINKILPELEDLRTTEQSQEFHPEGDAFQHTLQVIDSASKLKKGFSDRSDRIVLMFSALCHDMGKPQTTETTAEGKIISHGHDAVGAEVARKFMERLTNENDLIDRVEILVRSHMAPTNLYQAKAGDSAIRRLAKKVDIPMLVALSAADKRGRDIKVDLKAESWLMKKYRTLLLNRPETLEAKVRGRDLIPLGIQPGPDMGRLLNKIYSAQLDGKFETMEQGLDYARQQGWLVKGLFGYDINKAVPVKGFTRTRKGKREMVKPHTRTAKQKMTALEAFVGGAVPKKGWQKEEADKFLEEVNPIFKKHHFKVEMIGSVARGKVYEKGHYDLDLRITHTRGDETAEREDLDYEYTDPKQQGDLGRLLLNLQKKGLHFEINEPSGEEKDPTATLSLKDGRVVDLYYEEHEGKEGMEEKTPLLHLTYDKLAAGGRVKHVPKPDPEQEEAIRRWLSKSLLEYIGKPNTEETRKEIQDLVLKAIQVKGHLRTRRGKQGWVKPHHRQAGEISRKIPEVSVSGFDDSDVVPEIPGFDEGSFEPRLNWFAEKNYLGWKKFKVDEAIRGDFPEKYRNEKFVYLLKDLRTGEDFTGGTQAELETFLDELEKADKKSKEYVSKWDLKSINILPRNEDAEVLSKRVSWDFENAIYALMEIDRKIGIAGRGILNIRFGKTDDGDESRGIYVVKEKLIEIDDRYPRTVPHEFGHFLFDMNIGIEENRSYFKELSDALGDYYLSNKKEVATWIIEHPYDGLDYFLMPTEQFARVVDTYVRGEVDEVFYPDNHPEYFKIVNDWGDKYLKTGVIKSKSIFLLDLKKSRKELVNLRKSRVEGKKIPYRNDNGKVVWAKVMDGGVVIKGTRDKVFLGTKILIKSDIANVTGVGRDGVIARTDNGKKYQVLHKDLNFWVRR